MDLTGKYREVKEWLDSKYEGKTVPSFEHNETTLQILHELMETNKARDRDSQLVIEDLAQKTKEYGAESHRLSSSLERLGLKLGSLSQSGQASLKTLVDIAWLLQIKDASDTSYLLGLQDLQSRGDSVHEELLAEEQLLIELASKTRQALTKQSAIVKTSGEMRDQADVKEAKVLKDAKDTVFLHKRAHEYAKLLPKFKQILSRNKVDSSILHETLVKKSQELESMQDGLEKLKKKLKDYHDLSPDMNEAKVQISDLKNKLAKMEEELNKKIDVMRM